MAKFKRIWFRTNKYTRHKTFMISPQDFDLCQYENWRLDFCGRGHYRVVRYATKAEREKGAPAIIKLHRLIMGLDKKSSGGIVDHINGNTLDNTRENLRIVTHKENMNNTKKNRHKAKVFEPAADEWTIYLEYLTNKGV